MGLVKVKYLIDHGTSKKDDEKKLPESTANALEAHKVVKVLDKKGPKQEEKQ